MLFLVKYKYTRMMLIELEKNKTLQEIVHENMAEFTRECRGNLLDVEGDYIYTHKYLLSYYAYDTFRLRVATLLWHTYKEYKDHYDRYIKGIAPFQEVDFTLDILDNMSLTPNEADEMFKEYEEKFVEEEKYELLTYLNNRRNG